MYKQISDSAEEFLIFITAIHDDLNAVITASRAPVVRENQYSKIVIVAHSLGAVVSRVALTNGYQDNLRWLDKCHLVLFAPAHNGAHKSLVSFLQIGTPMKLVGSVISYFVLTMSQLIDRSIIIEPMKTKIEKLIEEDNVRTFTIAKRVIWSKKDRIVINDRFLEDRKPDRFSKSHEDICKPTRKYTQPFDLLKEIL